jgi:hypothetical protein
VWVSCAIVEKEFLMSLTKSDFQFVAMEFLNALQDYVHGISRKADETKSETLYHRVILKSKGKKLSNVGSVDFGVTGGNHTLSVLARFLLLVKEVQEVKEIKKRMEKMVKDDKAGQLALITLLEILESRELQTSPEAAAAAMEPPKFVKSKQEHSHQRSTHYRLENNQLVIEFREETPGWGSADFLFDLSEKRIILKSSRTETEKYSFSENVDINKLEKALNHSDDGSALQRLFFKASMDGSLKNFKPELDSGYLDTLLKPLKKFERRPPVE